MLIFALATQLFAQDEPKIQGQLKYDPYKLVDLKALNIPKKGDCKWKITPSTSVDRLKGLSKEHLVFTAPPGKYEITLTWGAIKDDGGFTFDDTTVTVLIGSPPPTPPGPAPGPTPNPPQPDSTSLFTGEGLRMLLLYETGDTLTKAQVAAIYGQEVREYLNTKTPLGADGKTHEWRIYDKDLDLSKVRGQWNEVKSKTIKNPNYKTPWVVIGNGKTGYEGPIPETGLLPLLKQYGGN